MGEQKETKNRDDRNESLPTATTRSRWLAATKAALIRLYLT